MEWDDGEVAPSPLQPVDHWPGLKGRRQRFNPRQTEGQEEVSPLTAAMDGGSSADPGQTRATTPASNPTSGAATPFSKPTNEATTTASRPTPGPPRERHREEGVGETAGPRTERSSVFSRLGQSKPTALHVRQTVSRIYGSAPRGGCCLEASVPCHGTSWTLSLAPASFVDEEGIREQRATNPGLYFTTIAAGRRQRSAIARGRPVKLVFS